MIYSNSNSGTNFIDISDFPFGKNGMQFPVVSLFSGAGGLDIGLEEAGFHTAVCVEYDTDCRETLRFNRPDWKLFEDGLKTEKGKMRPRIPGDIRDISVDGTGIISSWRGSLPTIQQHRQEVGKE